MTLNSYYKFKRTTGKSRHDRIESTGDYLHFEQNLINAIGYNKGGLSLHLGARPAKWNSRGHRSDQAITKSNNISTLYLADIKKPTVFYGDAKGTSDALVMVVSGDTLEIFIAKGLKNIQSDVCYEFSSGGLDSEIETLRARSKAFDLPPIG
jgi:hypothetical protein